MSDLVPEGWKAYELGNLASKIEGGGTPPRNERTYWEGSIPWATVKDLKGVRLSTTQECISQLGLDKSPSKLIPAYTLILASRMAVGKAVVFDKDVAINQDLKAFYPKDSLNWQYLLHWYLSRSEYIEGMGTGSTVKGIRLDDLNILPIDLPPLPEQQKIAAILTSVDEVIEKTAAQIAKLKDLKTAMMQELLTRGVGVDGKPHTEFKDSPVGRIPKGWEVLQISSLCSHIVDCVNKTASVVDYQTPYKMIRTTNVRHGRVDTENVRNVTQETYEAWTRRLLPENGDLIFTREAPVGECGILKDARGVFLGQRTMMYRADETKTSSKFLMYSLMSEYGKQQLEDFSGGSTVPHMRVPDCGKILIKTPLKEEQDVIVNSLNSIDISIEIKEAKLRKITNTKKALMQDLLTGKVRVKVGNA